MPPVASASPELVARSVNAIRSLSIDGVQAANSGHPGLPLGAAPMAYALWARHLRFDPTQPAWPNRDRFILSAGHGSMLIYSLLHLAGYDLPLEELRRFRQLHSRTPGHPENFLAPGVEVTTGPLGQGFAHAVGIAIAERWLGATYNREGHAVMDHFTYVLCSDGDLMEGISSEAASLAGHLKLGKLIALYDDNNISLDGPTHLSFSEDVAKRFEAMGWATERVDGMDVDAVDGAIARAKQSADKPTLILCRTIIGYGSPNKAGSQKAHGSPLGPDEVKLTKEALGIPTEPDFFVFEDAAAHWREVGEQGTASREAWDAAYEAYRQAYPAEAAQLRALFDKDFGTAWIDALPSFGPDEKQATRQASNKVINAIAPHHPALVGGSADLSESTLTTQKGSPLFHEDPAGRNVFFGVREHAMAAAANGIVMHGAIRSYAGTFFNFSDYCKPSLRLASLMECPTIFVFTHDSIGLGEDGPTHQPVEQLTMLRAQPNFNVIRPCDGNETSAAWKVALSSTGTPSALILSRQTLPTLSPADVRNHPLERGAYVLREAEGGPARVILIGTGSEVQHCVAARDLLQAEGIPTRVVSMPSWYLFANQDAAYREEILPKGTPKVSVEAGSTLAWPRFSDAQVGIDRFGLSAPLNEVMREFGFTPENVANVARGLLA